jgi:hypothetical protein
MDVTTQPKPDEAVAETIVDQARLEQFLSQAVTDMGAAMNGVLVLIGGELGLWEALAGGR